MATQFLGLVTLLLAATAGIVIAQNPGNIQYSCDRQPFKDTCELTGTPSQFSLRWYVKDGECCSYPWGHCKGDEVTLENSLRTKEACEEVCLGGGRGAGVSGDRPRGAGPGYDGGRGGGPSGGITGGRGGAGGGASPPGVAPSDAAGSVQKSCQRVPFKATCELTGTPSQFTLRWFVKDGECCSYPWGHCKGDEVATESSIRTKEECEEVCLGRGGGRPSSGVGRPAPGGGGRPGGRPSAPSTSSGYRPPPGVPPPASRPSKPNLPGNLPYLAKNRKALV